MNVVLLTGSREDILIVTDRYYLRIGKAGDYPFRHGVSKQVFFDIDAGEVIP